MYKKILVLDRNTWNYTITSKLLALDRNTWYLHIRLKEHKSGIKIVNLNNALFQHISQSNHNFDFSFVKMLI